MQKNILGISGFYHDSAAVLLRDGIIIAAAGEERFTRKKHDSKFPVKSIEYCLKEGNLKLTDVDFVVFYEKPLEKFDRLIYTYFSFAPKGFKSFFKSIPTWLKEKLYLKTIIRKQLTDVAGCSEEQLPPLRFSRHHQSHAASAFFASPFESAAILCLDGVGEWATSSVWKGEGNCLTPLWEIHFPHSLGLLYSAFTYYVGFKVNSGEYKLMGLAPYGEPKYVDLIYDNLIDLKEDGTFRLDLSYFNFSTGFTMISKKFEELFGGPPALPDQPITQHKMDVAASIQKVVEEIILKIAHSVHKETNMENLCLAGGVALNCVANGRLLREGDFKNIWIQPAAGDSGGALGAALTLWHEYLNQERTVAPSDIMQGSLLGPEFSNEQIETILKRFNANYSKLPDEELFNKVAKIIDEGNVVGWFQGRMEFGPRALGSRSIIGDPRNSEMQATLNQKIKRRETFRPFAPAVLEEHVSDYFQLDQKSPYMLLVAQISEKIKKTLSSEDQQRVGIEKLKLIRSTLPSITHVDYSARVQTVNKESNPKFYKLIKSFQELTDCSVLVNTSFNIRGEPIVCTPEEAYHCFMQTEMDYLVLENCLLSKKEQNAWLENKNWERMFEKD